VGFGFQSDSNASFFFFFPLEQPGVFSMKQREIELATVYMQMFLAGLALNFGANFHELEEITKHALFQVENPSTQ
jgi:hypothetical protein